MSADAEEAEEALNLLKQFRRTYGALLVENFPYLSKDDYVLLTALALESFSYVGIQAPIDSLH
jgi:hypothetical protein